MRSVVDLPQPDGPTRTMNSLVGDVEVEFLHGDDALVGDLQVVLLLAGFVLLLLLLFLVSAVERIDLLDVFQNDFCHIL